MADPGIEAFQAGSEILSGAPIPFRFEVTWRSLTAPLKPTPPDLSPRPIQAPLPRPQRTRDADAREWEMVLPKMRRPAALAPAPPRQLQPAIASPQFASVSEPTGRQPWVGLAIIAVVLAAGIAAYEWRSPSKDSVAATSMEVGGSGWITEWASDAAGSARGRQLSLYRPSISMSDYRLDFLGRIDRRSLGWVFRAVDSSNYYAAKLEASRPGAQTLTITRFAVIHGFEGMHIQRTLTLAPGAGEILKVRLEARGPRFTVSVQNQVVEDWEDDRLKSGGLGFLNEREEQGQVGSIQIAFPKGGAR
jgi:hypothetical protein